MRCARTPDDDAVLGSQSILGSYDEDDLPPEATASQEADLAFLDDPDRHKADQVEAAIGEMPAFYDQNGVYAEGTHVDTATLPEGWRDRLIGWDLQSSHPATPHFLEQHDLAVAKLPTGREKDKAFVDALIRTGMLDVAVIRERDAYEPAAAAATEWPPECLRVVISRPSRGRRLVLVDQDVIRYVDDFRTSRPLLGVARRNSEPRNSANSAASVGEAGVRHSRVPTCSKDRP